MVYLQNLTNEKITDKWRFPFSQNIFLLLVCPSCEEEIVGKWSYVTEMDSPKRNECDASTMEKIASEIESFLLPENFLCPCCGHALSRDPGYFLFEDRGAGRRGGYIDGFGENQECYAPLYNLYVNNKLNFTNDAATKMYAREGYRNSSLYPFDHGMFIYKYNSIAEDFFKINEYKDSERDEISDICVTVKGPGLFADRRELTIMEAFSLLKYYRKRLDKLQRLNNIINGDYCDTEIFKNKSISVDNSTEGIKQYLFNLIQLETTIMALSKRLPDLYKIQVEMDEKEVQERIKKEQERQAKREQEREKEERLRQEIIQAENEFNNLKAIEELWKTYYEKIYVTKTNIIFKNYAKKPQKPSEPELVIARLFNKKKVTVENERRQAAYAEELSRWEKEMNDWQNGLDQQNSVAAEEAEIEARKEAEQALYTAEQEIEKKKKELQIVEQSLQESNVVKKEVVSEKIWDVDVRQGEELLKKCMEAKAIYEDTNVVFAKYRDIVAYSSFYEYLESGRCDSLSGRDGAYNLYESEIRQNMIISKLSDVINSLDDIKQNQFVIYSQLSSMNSDLNRLNDSMNNAVNSLQSINSNTAQTVYNTEVTAYYAKKNVELTNALGYLVALK